MGALFASGWALDDVLDLTWDQLSFVVYAVQSHKGEMLRHIQEVIVVSMGGKIDKPKKRKPRRKKRKPSDADKLRALQGMGITIHKEGG